MYSSIRLLQRTLVSSHPNRRVSLKEDSATATLSAQAHACSLSTLEAEAGEWQVLSQTIPCQKTAKTKQSPKNQAALFLLRVKSSFFWIPGSVTIPSVAA